MPDAAPKARKNLFRAAFESTQRRRPLIIAHRGDSSHAPENTLEAARLGWESGADAWELDVQLTRDGIPVVIHDDSLLRTTDVLARFPDDPRRASDYLVADFDFEEIRSLDAGSWFLAPGGQRTADSFGTLASLNPTQRSHFGSGKIKVPTLAEALALTVSLDWKVNVEIKSFPGTDPNILDAVLRLVDETDAATRILISSFDHADVARAVRSHPHLATGVLTVTPLDAPDHYVRQQVGADFYHPSADALGASSLAYRRKPSPRTLRIGDFDGLKAAGVPILTYTVNETSPDGIAVHLAEAGVGGIFTDDPASLKALFAGR
ncbi:glycerophosphodiester phosphodiesterase [Singulisphaera sp. PoT]|uniref:glycerophosphodiester phosphodiesterase n=1 Tax=Singulisphaera sp. PoT TaxID=3411797 RepID=UPI003BF4B949